MKSTFLQRSRDKILCWDRKDYLALTRAMTPEEISAMRQELIDNSYPIEEYNSSQPDYKEQIVFHYILFLLYEAEYSDCVDADTHKLYDILYYI